MIMQAIILWLLLEQIRIGRSGAPGLLVGHTLVSLEKVYFK